MRDKRARRLGALVAGFALYVQLVFAGAGAPVLETADAPLDTLGAHALCLAAERSDAPQPADSAPVNPATPAHDHSLVCCLWHSLAGVAPLAAPPPLPIRYASVVPPLPSAAPLIPAPRHSPVNARAPPILV